MSPDLDAVAHALGAKRSGSGFIAKCPAHDDDTPSLSLSKPNGKLLFKCHAGCPQDAIVDALRDRGLWPKAERQIVATYDYIDADGVLAFQVVRFEPKEFRQRRPDGKGGYLWNVRGAKVVPYNLPAVLKAISADEPIAVVEGEKDGESLRRIGITATTNAGGAGKWRREHSEYLRGARVAIVPDNDDVGSQHAEQVASSLRGIAAEIKIVALPDLPPKGDVSDWLANGGTRTELDALISRQAAHEAHPAEPALGPGDRALHALPLRDFLRFDFKPRELLLDPWLATQSLAMVHGPRGIGKTWFTSSVGFTAASAGSAFGWRAPRQVRTAYLDGEMAGVDLQDRFAALYTACAPDWDGSTLHVVTPDACAGAVPDLATVAGQIAIEEAIGDAEFIILDNLSAWVRGTGEENSAESWMPVLDWLLRMRTQGRSVLVVHHSGKTRTQRGTSKREDVLDVVIGLRRTPQQMAQDGARFELHFEKARGLSGDAIAPFEAQLTLSAKGLPLWTTRTITESNTARILALDADGLSQADIARELGLNRSTVSRALKNHATNATRRK